MVQNARFDEREKKKKGKRKEKKPTEEREREVCVKLMYVVGAVVKVAS